MNHTEQTLGSGALAGAIGAAIGGRDAGIISGAAGAWIADNGTCPDDKSLKIEKRRYSGNVPIEDDPRGAKTSHSCVD